jgi:uncharacterized protein (TIGR00299 family) protein
VKVLEINPSVAGVSGDMLVAALADLAGDTGDLEAIFTEHHLEFTLHHIEDNVLPGKRLELSNETQKLTGNQLRSLLETLVSNLSPVFSKMAIQTIDILLEAEMEVHQTKDIHLHELGTLDTAFDIFSVCYLMDRMGIEKVNLHPIATGSGTVKTQHGVLPVPAPATRQILQRFELPTIIGPEGEAATPTGVALLAAISSNLSQSSSVVFTSQGVGYGTKEFHDRKNMLRLQLGSTASTPSSIAILETNLDDVSGEILGGSFQDLLDHGALDVSMVPIIMKKNRPAYTLRVLCRQSEIDQLAERIIRLTGTLGVRVLRVDRHIGNREVEEKVLNISALGGECRVRVKHGARMKVEFDDLQEIAERENKTVLEVEDIVYRELYRQ